MILTGRTSLEEATATWTAPQVPLAAFSNATEPVRDCCLLFPITHTAAENLSLEVSATSCRLKPLSKPWQPLSKGFYFCSTPTTLLSPALTEDEHVAPSVHLMPPFPLHAGVKGSQSQQCVLVNIRSCYLCCSIQLFYLKTCCCTLLW